MMTKSSTGVFFGLNRYGRGVGIYKTHLFGSPSIIACDPPINKFILQSDDLFRIRWPSVDLVGRHSFVATEGETHSRLKTFVLNAINKPDSLKQITQAVQPRLISSLRSWADRGGSKHPIKPTRWLPSLNHQYRKNPWNNPIEKKKKKTLGPPDELTHTWV